MIRVDLGNGELVAGEPHWVLAAAGRTGRLEHWRRRRDPRDHAQLQRELHGRMSGGTRAELTSLRVVASPAVRHLTAMAEAVDGGTPEHSQRVGQAAEAVARRLGLDEGLVALIRDAAPLHDVGKVQIPPTLLQKAGPLTTRERVTMQRHAAAGEQLCRAAGDDPILRMASHIARSHHERWDGRGYPDGLSVDRIPLAARIVAVVDVHDALLSERPYKGAWRAEKALAYLAENAGSQFDADVVAAFIALIERGELTG